MAYSESTSIASGLFLGRPRANPSHHGNRRLRPADLERRANVDDSTRLSTFAGVLFAYNLFLATSNLPFCWDTDP
jgi:hypothetical protein